MFILISILAVIGALLVAVFMVAIIWTCAESYSARAKERSYESAKKYVRGMLRCDSCWFSEDPPTENLIRNLASGMEVGQARGQWNRERLLLMAKRRLAEHAATVAEQQAGNRAQEFNHPNQETKR